MLEQYRRTTKACFPARIARARNRRPPPPRRRRDLTPAAMRRRGKLVFHHPGWLWLLVFFLIPTLIVLVITFRPADQRRGRGRLDPRHPPQPVRTPIIPRSSGAPSGSASVITATLPRGRRPAAYYMARCHPAKGQPADARDDSLPHQFHHPRLCLEGDAASRGLVKQHLPETCIWSSPETAALQRGAVLLVSYTPTCRSPSCRFMPRRRNSTSL
jgi:hypothetical protein